MLWNLHILEKPCHSCESRNPEVCSQTEIRIPAPRFRGDKFREHDIYTRILILLKIYVELRLIMPLRKLQPFDTDSVTEFEIIQNLLQFHLHVPRKL